MRTKTLKGRIDFYQGVIDHCEHIIKITKSSKEVQSMTKNVQEIREILAQARLELHQEQRNGK